MPASRSPDFRDRAVELARQRVEPIAQITKASDSRCRPLPMDGAGRHRRWQREGLSSDERKELVELRRHKRLLAMEVERARATPSGGPSVWSA